MHITYTSSILITNCGRTSVLTFYNLCQIHNLDNVEVNREVPESYKKQLFIQSSVD